MQKIMMFAGVLLLGVLCVMPVQAAHVEDKNPAPQTLNIDFGPDRNEPPQKTGAAAAGQAGDYWNNVSVASKNKHTETKLKFANGTPSAISIELDNLGGSWTSGDKMAINDPMLATYNYPRNNHSGNATVTLYNVPAGSYDLYIYGHGASPGYYGDYEVTVGKEKYGRKKTSQKNDAAENTAWVEDSQYVRFTHLVVNKKNDVTILVRPGATVTEPSGRSFADAMISGLQLIGTGE